MMAFHYWFRLALDWIVAIGFACTAGALVGRSFCLRRLLTVREARMVRLSDSLLWLGLGLMGVPRGLLAFSELGLGRFFYFGNPVQWIQIAGFLVVGGLEIWPSRQFRSWDRYLDLGQVPFHTDRDNDRFRFLLKLQMAVLSLLPLANALIQRGIGLPH